MSRFELSRRRFLAALKLGVGAGVLGPIASRLYGEAWGAESGPAKRVVFITMGGGLPDLQLGAGTRRSATEWGFHEGLAALAPWQSRSLVLCNLNLKLNDSQHGGSYGLMAGAGAGGGETDAGNAPVGQTIDQFIAARLSQEVTMKSLLCGVDQAQTKNVTQSVFASAAGQPMSHPSSAAKLFETLFPAAASSRERVLADTRVVSAVNADVKRLRARLAGEEGRRLDGYLESLEAFDKRRTAASCTVPSAPAAAQRGAVPEIPLMLDMAAVALQCGMTRVVGCSVGGGNSHFKFPQLVGPHKGTIFESRGYVWYEGHETAEIYSAGRTVAWKWLSGVVADFLKKLETPGPSGRSLLEDTVVVLSSDGGVEHHNLSSSSWRFMLIGNAGGALKADGRFLTYEPEWKTMQTRSVNNLWCTLAHAMGAPTDTFGAGALNGPMPELLA